jgi:hypothetical protein
MNVVKGDITKRWTRGVKARNERAQCVCCDPRWFRIPGNGSRQSGLLCACAACGAQWKTFANYTRAIPRAPVGWESMKPDALKRAVDATPHGLTPERHDKRFPYGRGE